MTKHTPQLPLFPTESNDPLQEIPYGYCHCGCGQKTKIATQSNAKRGHAKDEPYRFLHGHRSTKTIGPGPNPSGLCMCGCGQPAPIASQNSRAYGWVKGKPICYIQGHYARTIWRPATERFWNNVDKRGPDECWEWQAHVNDSGYGIFNARKKHTRVHRFSYELHFGPISDDIFVCHKCDNRRCVNPAHLWLGTTADNTQDMIEKGRMGYTGSPGEKHPQSKLSDNQVRDIRQLCTDGMTQKCVAKLFGVSETTVGRIVKRKAWAHIK